VKLIFCLLVFLMTTTLCGLGQAQSIKTTLHVCVNDESNKPVTENLNLTLLNSPSKINDKADKDKCFTSDLIKLDLTKTYFVMAEKDELIAYSMFRVKKENDNQIVPLTLQLQKPGKGVMAKPSMEICAQDENKNPLPVTDLSPSDTSGNFTREANTKAGCTRIKLGNDNEYQLTLMTQGKHDGGSSGFQPIYGWLFLWLAALLLLTGGLFFKVNGIARLQAISSKNDATSPILQQLHLLSQDIDNIKAAVVEEQQEHSQPPPTQVPAATPKPAPPEPGSITPAASRSTTAGEDSASARQPPSTPAPEVSLLNRSLAEARQKYRDFRAGMEVDHFYLMPLGFSSASQTVEVAKVILREQEHGTYIAFCLAGNESEAWVFPMPGYHFTSEAFSALFTNLTEQEYQSGEFEPRRAISTEPKLWKIE
jgi:hypothetical protein